MDAKKIEDVFPVNKIINGKWVIDGRHGGGGMGIVYRAHPVKDARQVVIVKTLTNRALNDDVTVTYFFKEAEALRRINYDGVVKIFDDDYDTESGRPYIVMEFADGVLLTDVISRGRMDTRKCGHLIREIALALKAAHAQDVYHRDLKPDNIIVVEREGEPDKIKLIDFGVAKVKDSSVGKSTSAEMIVGTVEYFSPEQCSSSKGMTIQSEVFTLAAVAYQMLTRQLAFPVSNTGTLREKTFKLRALQERGHMPLRKVRGDLPKAVEAVFLKGLAVNPEKRYRTPIQFADALASALRNEVVRPQQTVYPTRPKWKATRRWLVPLTAVLLLLFFLFAGGLYYFKYRPSPAAKDRGIPTPRNSRTR
jgi:eukaryotic-like serine/threonine-protein kinase